MALIAEGERTRWLGFVESNSKQTAWAFDLGVATTAAEAESANEPRAVIDEQTNGESKRILRIIRIPNARTAVTRVARII